MTRPTVVFDLDGTLVDTAPDLVATLNTIFKREGIPPVDYQSARNMVGGGARVMIERGLATTGRKLPAGDVERMHKGFLDHYAAHIADESRPFEGVEAALDELSTKGFCLAVCTNKLERLATQVLDALNLSSRFAVICGADSFGIAKPDPTVLHRTITLAGGLPERAVMVGDSLTDIATARAAAVPVIAVDFGYSETAVAEFSPDHVVSSFAELPRLIAHLLERPLPALER
jgi:phosphoglycolate phosphatase